MRQMRTAALASWLVPGFVRFNQLAGTVSRLQRSMLRSHDADKQQWEQHLSTALEAVQLVIDGAEASRQAMMAEAASAVRAALAGALPPLSTQ